MLIEWWNSLAFATQVFYCIAVPATLVLFIQTVLMFIGLGDDGDGIDDIATDDIGGDVDEIDGVFGDDSVYDGHDAAGLDGLRVFTVRGIVAFFVVFGWVGALMNSAGAELFVTIPVALVCGFAMMFLIAFLLKAVIGLRSDGNADNRNAIGISGKVHLTIPAARKGEGKVHIMLQGAYVERNAVTDSEEAIPTGSEVVVVGVSGQTDLIVKKK